MLASIHPLGERARARRWGLTVSAYVVGSLAGGSLLGAALGAIGSPLRADVRPGGTAWAALVGVGALAGVRAPLSPVVSQSPARGQYSSPPRPRSRRGAAEGRTMPVLAAAGLTVAVPRGWEARIYRRVPDGGTTTHTVLHAANFPLPVE